jgi:hypothetical protein
VRFASIVAGALLAMQAGAVLACGVCIEDKVAATYDHAVVERAHARKLVMVFVEVVPGPGAVDVAAAGRAARSLPGVDASSVRTRDEPATLSFALDPSVRAPEAAVKAIERAGAKGGAKLKLLKVIA